MALLLNQERRAGSPVRTRPTARMWAATAREIGKTVRVLLDRGAELDSRDDRGMTSADRAQAGLRKDRALIEGKAVEGR
ncbi:MAG: hypothetical protein IPK20_21195 [Betaproteobacteria bacterium]|nr:hypothetical protein [Betaproteobacteria bacterium]